MDISGATTAGAARQRYKRKGRKWQKRLHLRKAALKPPTMQSKDKCGPKTITEKWQQSKVWPSSKKTPQEAQPSQHVANDSENMLQFTCSQCSDNMEYAPKDLVRHFEDKHRGTPPVFSCHTCTYITHEFSYLQIHLLSHKDTFSGCSFCNDGVQRTWPEFSAHLTMYHCQSGKFSCESCHRFTTGDVAAFLEHMYLHNLGLEGANDDGLLHTRDKKMSGTKPTTLCCQHCDYKASQKWLLTKHIKSAHACQNGDQRQKKRGINSIAMKPNDPIPETKPRLTRSAVREMCWLTQDCLSLPGREFLDKYCHLSDPQTTLEETQQFLMKSVAGEAGDQNWTKALKTVLSNVPQDVNLHPKSENGIVSKSSDLTVLKVKNKITVAQNGASYAKRLKRTTALDKDSVLPESPGNEAQCGVELNECHSTVNDNLPQTENNLHNDVSVPAQSETAELQENGENQDLKIHWEMEEDAEKLHEPMQEDVVSISSELNLANESTEQTAIHKIQSQRRQKQRGNRKAVSKRVDNSPTGLPLKIVLKKNPVKEKQWVSKSFLFPSGGDSPEQFSENALVTEVHQQNGTKASKTDVCVDAEAITSIRQSNPGEPIADCAPVRVGSENVDVSEPAECEGSLSALGEPREDSEELSQTGIHKTISAAETNKTNLRAVVESEVDDNKPQTRTSESCTNHQESDDERISAADKSTTQSSCSEESSLLPQPVITPQGNVEDSNPALSSELGNHNVDLMTDRDVPLESCPNVLSSVCSFVEKAIQQETSPVPRHQPHQVPKDQERTLKLVAINPSQLVKRPTGDQPVVVLNHPDADIPEVARIMEVVNRYRGEVQKVILSRRTLKALSAMTSDAPKTHDPTEIPANSAEAATNSVKERFILKMKLRRLSRKKFEVVDAARPRAEVPAKKYRCWFCGRVFERQEMCLAHRQRHLLDWKRPNCENS